MSVILAFIVIGLLVAISSWLERISDALSDDIAEALETWEKTLRKENKELKKALKEGEE